MKDARAEFFNFVVAEAVDGFQFRQVLRTSEHDVAEGCRGEDEEEREIESFGFSLTPFSEALIEGLLIGGEGFDRFLRAARACEGFRSPRSYPRG